MNWITVVYVALIVIGILVFFLKQRIQKWMATGAKILLLVSVVGALLGAFTVSPFVFFAEISLKNAGTLETLQKIDQALPVEKVLAPVKDLVETIKNLWKPQEAQDVVALPQTEKVGILEAEVYPTLVAVTARTYKTATMVFSLLGLSMSVYVNYSVAGISELERMKKKYELLEKKVELLYDSKKE